MTRRFLYCFGYETPAQRRANDANGWDDESAFAFWITAGNADDAGAWGREVCEAIVRELFIRSDWRGEAPSWKEGAYAHWIDDYTGQSAPGALERLPSVEYGKMPTDLTWLIGKDG